MQNKYLAFIDGGSRGNPGPSACGYLIYEQNTGITTLVLDPKSPSFENDVKSYFRVVNASEIFLNDKTNNQAEWYGLIYAMKTMIEEGQNNYEVQIYMDSELVIKQALGIYKVKNPGLRELYLEFLELLPKFKNISFSHIYRENNKEADRLVNQCLDRES